MKITPENITHLEKDQIFVFGSNELGNHGGGAAKAALKWGAKNGKAFGLSGQTFALPTLDSNYQKLTLSEIKEYILALKGVVSSHPELEFLVTKIGCGIAGFSEKEIAPLFSSLYSIPNIHLPQEFWNELNGCKPEDSPVYGFKAMKKDEIGMYCDPNGGKFYYKVGQEYHVSDISICNYGFHFCKNIIDTLNYYRRADNIIYCKVVGWGKIQEEGDKVCTSSIKILEIFNHSDRDLNSGNRNSGNWNSGDRNSGDGNSGSRNSGNWNSGDWNSGDWNSGDRNSGNGNSGDRNSGDGNSGNWNSGNGNKQYFCTTESPTYFFNRISDKKIKDVYTPSWLHFDLNSWVDEWNMTDEQKEKHPYYNIVGGCLVVKTIKEAALEAYNKATKSEQDAIENIPNYDPQILFEILGIDRRKLN